MLKFLLWLFSKPEITPGEFNCFLFAMYFDGWWFSLVLFVGLVICTYIGGIVEAWRDDKAGGES